jgi:GT2 family glycosyltransferase
MTASYCALSWIHNRSHSISARLRGPLDRMNFPLKSLQPAAQIRPAVIIATKARPQALAELLRLLEGQSQPPPLVVISATAGADVELPLTTALNIECVYGPPGLTAQRNRGLAQINGRAEVAVFFDDDFAPAEDWLEQCARIFFLEPNIAGANGIVVRDGVKGTPVTWQEARLLLASRRQDPLIVSRIPDLYGCNMAFRMSAIGQLQFDEQLVLYGWLEDKDFSRKAAQKGDLVQCNLLVGVHLGLQAGRVSGKRYGYSQVVNAWYLYRKGTMSLREASVHILKALAANAAKSVRPQSYIDRRGRLRGNLVGVAHLLSGSCRPERASQL